MDVGISYSEGENLGFGLISGFLSYQIVALDILSSWEKLAIWQELLNMTDMSNSSTLAIL